MRIVGKQKPATTDEEKWVAGARASELMRTLGIPSFRQGGVFRGPQSMFDQMDDERIKRRQRWLNEHSA